MPHWRQCFTDVGGADKPDWRYILVRLKKDGTPDARCQPKWLRARREGLAPPTFSKPNDRSPGLTGSAH